MRKILSAILAVAMTFTLIIASAPKLAIASTDLSGTYIIKNVTAGVCVGAASYVANQPVRSQTLSVLTDQKWIFELQSSGYYTIKLSSAPNLYLTVQNNSATSGASVILSTYTGGNGQLWSLAGLNSGYRIIPKCAPSYVMSPPVGTAPYDSCALVTAPYRADGYDYELWQLKPIGHTLTLVVDHDDAYSERYSSTYNSRINDCINLLNYRLVVDAGIHIQRITTSYDTDIYADSCTSSDNYNDACSCGTCRNSTATSLQSYHQTNINNVLYRITNNSTADIRAVFTGYEMCEQGHLTHIDNLSENDVFYRVWKTRDVALIKDFKPDFGHDAVAFACAILELYGLEVHMNASGQQNNNCIFGLNANTAAVRDSCTICAGCLSALQQLADEY